MLFHADLKEVILEYKQYLQDVNLQTFPADALDVDYAEVLQPNHDEHPALFQGGIFRYAVFQAN